MLLVLAGRAAFRLMLWATGPVLLAAWGRAQFAPYAAAMGVCTGLIVVVAAGPEKAALKLVPRARRTRDELVRTLRTACGIVSLGPVAAAAAATAAGPRSDAALVVTAAAYCTALGSLMVVAALHRARDRPRHDAAAFACLAAGIAMLLAITFTTSLGALGYLWGQVALTLAVTAPLWHGLRPADDTVRPRRPDRGRLRRLFTGSAVLMGLPEVLTAAATSAIYFELTLTSHTAQAAELYLALQGWSLLVSATYLLQRLVQPRLSVRLAQDRSAEGVARALRLTRVAVVLAGAWLGVVGVLLASGAMDPPSWSPARLLLVLALLCVSRAPLYVLMSQATFILENTDAAGLRAGTRANVLGVLCVVAAGAAVTPLVGAVGAVVALGVRELVTGSLVLGLSRPAIEDH